MTLQAIRSYDIVSVAQSRLLKDDLVAVEEPLEIWLKVFETGQQANVYHLSTTMRTPGNDIELVRGWIHANNLVASHLIHSISYTGTEALKNNASNKVLVTLEPGITLDVDKMRRAQYASSSCGVCGQQSIEWMMEDIPCIRIENRMIISTQQLVDLPQALNDKQPFFNLTGGMHGVALIDENAQVIDAFEDVGRHNAMDKLIGANLLRLPGKYGVLLSGRVSFEMVHKAARAGISLIIAIGAPSSLAIDLCEQADIALVGFLKPNQFNIYCGDSQID